MSSGTDGKFGEMTWKTWRWATRLHRAILSNTHEREIRKLAAECADVNQPDQLHSNKTPLHLAALWRNVNVTKILLRAGGDASARDSDGRTPLHDAAIQGKMDVIIEILKAKGADKNAVDGVGQTALHLAASKGNVLAVKSLMSAGVDYSILNKKGLTAQEVARKERLRLESIQDFPSKLKRVAELREVEAILEDTKDITDELEGRMNTISISGEN